jgi:hypothetical protein
MISSVKPVLTVDLCVVQKEDIFNNMLYVWNVHLTKGQETNPSSRQRGCYIRFINAGVWWKRNVWSWVSRGLTPRRTNWRYTASRKVSLTLTLVLSCQPDCEEKTLRVLQYSDICLAVNCSLQSVNLGQSVELHGRVISSSHDLYLHRTAQT